MMLKTKLECNILIDISSPSNLIAKFDLIDEQNDQFDDEDAKKSITSLEKRKVRGNAPNGSQDNENKSIGSLRIDTHDSNQVKAVVDNNLYKKSLLKRLESSGNNQPDGHDLIKKIPRVDSFEFSNQSKRDSDGANSIEKNQLPKMRKQDMRLSATKKTRESPQQASRTPSLFSTKTMSKSSTNNGPV